MVLGVYCNGRYGSLGMSRRRDLMDKPLAYRTLGELVSEFESSYKRYQHTLKKVGRHPQTLGERVERERGRERESGIGLGRETPADTRRGQERKSESSYKRHQHTLKKVEGHRWCDGK